MPPEEEDAPRKRTTIARALAIAYPLAVIGLWLGFSVVGEDSWLLTALIYAPHLLLVLPLLALVPVVIRVGPRWTLIAQAAAMVVVLGPLAGLEFSPLRDLREARYERGTPIRILSQDIGA